NVERDLAGYEVYISTTSGFTPDPSTLKTSIPAGPGEPVSKGIIDLVPGQDYYVRLIAVDTSGNRSAASDEVSAVAGKVGTSDIQFDAIESYTIVSRIETDVITTTSRSYIDSDLVTPYLNLRAGDKVLIFAKASALCTASIRSTDARIRY